ncbi:MAG: transglycosylase SLT domain-containing protein [Alistipes sp.]|nr:transglycosylase SLT domain-containing protein [Alistipes sp.]
MRRTLSLLLALLCFGSALAGPIRLNIFNKNKKTPKQQNIVTIYDTVRVVVTDTVIVEAKPSARIDTLQITHTPQQIDSLLDIWHTMSIEQSQQQYFAQYSAPMDEECNLPKDSLYKQRLQDMVSPVHLPYNSVVRHYIDYYLENRWSPLSRVIALSKYYFPIFEQELVRAGLPIELRVLAIVESNLSPTAGSRAGAVGLWQFMPSTGKNLGLEVNSLVDERSDLILSTRAACSYLKYLYDTFGDWALALAAYNAGPGRVSRALARAGNAKTYWDIYDDLNAETRGYVPKFIAASYAYAYHQQHNITPEKTPECISTDTVVINRTMHLGQVASTLDIPMETLKMLNPQYKIDIVPAARKPYTLRLPTRYIAEFISQQDSIYSKDSLYLKEYLNPANLDKKRAEGLGYTYTVRSGDNLGLIAKRNRCTVKDIMRWNKLKSTTIRPGQKLRINKPKPRA